MGVSTTYSEKILQEFPYADKANLSRKIMIHFIISLLFPIGAGFYYFGIAMIRTAVACVVFSVLTEWVLNKIMQKESTLGDLTAIATGLVIAINMRPGIGLYPLLLTCIVGIAIGKIIFGGAGFNPINPAVVGRLLPVAGFPALWATAIRPTIPNLMEYAGLTYWEANLYTFVRDVKTLPFYNKVVAAQPAYATYPFTQDVNEYYDVLSGTTYLETIKNWYKSGVMPEGMTHSAEFFDYWTLFLGNIPGTLGETSKLALLLGFVYLVATRVITPLIPVLIWGFMAVFGWIFAGTRLGPVGFGPLGLFAGDPMIWVLAGGAILGSVYMETDPVSSPRTVQAKVLYSLLFVSIVTAIRLVFSFPEGVSFALLGSNLIIPFLDKFCDPNNKNAKLISKSLIGVGIFASISLVGIFIFKTFFSTPIHESQVRSILKDTNISAVIPHHTHPSGRTYYSIQDGSGKHIANAYHTSAEGYDDGLITMMVVISNDTILGVGAMDLSSQTEGIGQNGYDPEFLRQFSGKKSEDISKYSEEWVDIDMISGATMTTDAIAQTIHEAFILEQQLKNKK